MSNRLESSTLVRYCVVIDLVTRIIVAMVMSGSHFAIPFHLQLGVPVCNALLAYGRERYDEVSRDGGWFCES